LHDYVGLGVDPYFILFQGVEEVDYSERFVVIDGVQCPVLVFFFIQFGFDEGLQLSGYFWDCLLVRNVGDNDFGGGCRDFFRVCRGSFRGGDLFDLQKSWRATSPFNFSGFPVDYWILLVQPGESKDDLLFS